MDRIHRLVDSLFVEYNVTDRESTESLVEAAVTESGTVEMLVNNAGGSGSETFQEFETEAQQAGFDLNLTGPFNCTKAVMPMRLEHGNSRVANTSSMAGRNVTVNGYPSYTASKWG